MRVSQDLGLTIIVDVKRWGNTQTGIVVLRLDLLAWITDK